MLGGDKCYAGESEQEQVKRSRPWKSSGMISFVLMSFCPENMKCNIDSGLEFTGLAEMLH